MEKDDPVGYQLMECWGKLRNIRRSTNPSKLPEIKPRYQITYLSYEESTRLKKIYLLGA